MLGLVAAVTATIIESFMKVVPYRTLQMFSSAKTFLDREQLDVEGMRAQGNRKNGPEKLRGWQQINQQPLSVIYKQQSQQVVQTHIQPLRFPLSELSASLSKVRRVLRHLISRLVSRSVCMQVSNVKPNPKHINPMLEAPPNARLCKA